MKRNLCWSSWYGSYNKWLATIDGLTFAINIADGIGINVQTTLQVLILFGIQEPDMVTGMSIDIL